MSLTILEQAAATDDGDCLSWHQHCNAECCRKFYILDGEYDLSLPEIQVRTVLSKDSAWYYALHGCRYAHGILYVPTSNIVRQKGRLEVRQKCRQLQDDNRCSGHATGHKPKICLGFNMENLRKQAPLKAALTENCLYKYKLENEGGNTL